MSLILGIDPGSRVAGYGVIKKTGNKLTYVASGCIRIKEKELPQRLKQVFDGVTQLIAQYQPNEFAIEQVFMARNADSALKLGQARGVAIVAAVNAQLPVSEYAARLIKQAVVGTGAATKDQVGHMVTQLLKLPAKPQEDAADALAIAICHANANQQLIAAVGKGRGRTAKSDRTHYENLHNKQQRIRS